MSTNTKLAEALKLIATASPGEHAFAYMRNIAREALAATAEQAAQAVPAGPYVGLIERLMKLSTRLGIAHDDSVEHFAANLEDRLYAICRSAESLLDSLAPAAPAPAPEAQATPVKTYPPSVLQAMAQELAPQAQAAGRELPESNSVDEALEIVASFGPLGVDLNETHRRQILLAHEVLRLRKLGEMAVRGRAQMRAALEDARAALAQRQPLTDEQIAEGRYRMWADELEDAPEPWAFLKGARWAERYYGIGGATTGEQHG